MFYAKYKTKLLVLIASFLFSCFPTSSEAQIHYTDGLYWLRFQTNLNWDSPWSLSLQLEERRFHSPDRSHQRVLPELQVHYKQGQQEAYFSYLNFTIASPQTADLPVFSAVNEQRFGLAYILKKSIDKSTLAFKTLNEYRLFDSDPLDGDLHYAPFRMRWRNEISYRFPVADNWSVLMAEELHLNWAANGNYQVFDQNRVSIGLRYFLSSNLISELDYIHWYQKNRSGTEFYNRHILRFTILYNLDLTNQT